MSGLGIAGVVTLIVVGGLAFAALIGFWIWALVDAIKVPDESLFRAGSKIIWLLVILFLGLPGAIIYAVVGRPKNDDVAPSGEPSSIGIPADMVPPAGR